MFLFNYYIKYESLTMISTFLKMLFIVSFSFVTSLKLSSLSIKSKFSIFTLLLFTPIFSFLIAFIFNDFFTLPLIISFVFIIFLIANNFRLYHSLIITMISLCFNFIAYLIASLIVFPFSFTNNFTNTNLLVPIILVLYTIIILTILKFKRFKYGLTYINSLPQNDAIDFIILNFSSMIILLFILLPRTDKFFAKNTLYLLILFSVIMAITIYKSFSLYYKHNLLVKELNDTKLELEKKDKEIERLEKENLEFSKTSHSIAHKQRVLEYKLNQLQLNTEFANELDLSDKLKEISDTYSSNVTNLTLPKTGIENIDDILEYMQSECTKNNINFELQLNGDIFSMVTTVINKEKLEILLADHIKNAIIAINSSENINKSILVRLGLINDIYSIYFYDSGIEFDENVLSSLGKEQITTHKDIGGTGCGFLNTFDTLKEFNASLEINEISAPCKDNYTKSIVIKFDGKNDFEINSYKKQE